MKFKIYKALLVVSAAIVLNGCSKQETDPLMDARPDVPVSFPNATAYRPDPTVSTSIAAGGAIEIQLSIPEQSGRTITEISKIAVFTSYSRIQGASNFYVATPIPVNGTSYTYKTSLTEYYSKNPTAAVAKPNEELSNRFYFLIKLDDGSTIVTMPVRILVLS